MVERHKRIKGRMQADERSLQLNRRVERVAPNADARSYLRQFYQPTGLKGSNKLPANGIPRRTLPRPNGKYFQPWPVAVEGQPSCVCPVRS